MALPPATRLGPYEIVEPLGSGGMGEVYRGRDTRLGRSVAIKCSRDAFTERFHGEARAISALNHPHICTLYDVGPDYLVMELVEGESLAARLTRGALPIDQVLRYGAEIADALAAAHAKGIVHRDLKPANIMVTKSGVKVLDFGLAKFSGSLADTAVATQGVVGTPAYMAPEQLAGEAVDARTDIFALGLVLLEMATGQRMLVGHGQPAVLDGIPERLAHVIERCLARQPEDRWQSAGDVRRELEWAAKRPAPIASTNVEGQAPSRTMPRLAFIAGIALVALAAGAGISRLFMRPPQSEADVAMRTTIALPPGLRLESSAPLALSPDGTHLAFVAVDEAGLRHLYVRRLAALDATALPGTTGAMHPFFSPDGRSIGFFADGALQRVDVEGSTPLRLCPVGGTDHGGAWGANDTIAIAVRGRGMFKVSAAGGALQPIASDIRARFPSFLPDGRTILYASVGEDGRTIGFSVVGLDGSGRRDIARLSDVNGEGAPVLGATAELAQATVLSNGIMVFGQDPGFVRALPIDPQSLSPNGSVTTIGESVERGANAGGVAFTVARNGLLVFAGTGNDHQLVWVNRQGVVTPLDVERGAYREPQLSPDEKTIALSANDETRTPNLWLIDVERGAKTRIATEALSPVWAPDGRRLVYNSRGGQVTMTTLDGPSELLLTREQTSGVLIGTAPYPSDWTPDGRSILVQADNQDIWKLSVPDRTFERVLVREGNDTDATISADGQVVSYVSNESGRFEAYVARWPSLEQKTRVSTKGGLFPRWSRTSRELFFWQGQTLMSAMVDPAFKVSVPQPLFSGAFFGAAREGGFDIATDGRFLMVKADERAELRQLTVVQNWMHTP